MKKLYLRTPYGDQYHIHENGDIQRLDQHPSDQPFTASGEWKLLGIQHVKRSEFIPLSSLLAGNIPNGDIVFKNGKPQWTVRDVDHGTTRVWGNTAQHGVRFLSVVKP